MSHAEESWEARYLRSEKEKERHRKDAEYYRGVASTAMGIAHSGMGAHEVRRRLLHQNREDILILVEPISRG